MYYRVASFMGHISHLLKLGVTPTIKTCFTAGTFIDPPPQKNEDLIPFTTWDTIIAIGNRPFIDDLPIEHGEHM